MRRGGRRSYPDEFFRRFGPRRRRVNPLVVAVRWRRELALLLGVPWLLDALAAATQPWVAALPVAAAVGVFGVWQPGRRIAIDSARAVRTEHRLRVGMAQAGVVSWSGWLPAALITRRHPRGTRIVLWCPAGVDVHMFHDTRSLLAAACWASGVEVERHPRWAQVVVVLVVQRPDYWR